MTPPHLAVKLPEVVSQIIWHLAPYDSDPHPKQQSIDHRNKHHLVPCLLVNRLWYESTLRHLWRHVVFEDTKSDIASFYQFASALANKPISVAKPVPSFSSTTLTSLSISSPSNESTCSSTASSSTPLPSIQASPLTKRLPPPPVSNELYRRSIRSITLRRIKEKTLHEGLAAVANHAIHLQRLELYICDHVTNACLIPFFLTQLQTQLTHVSLAGCHQVSDESILVLARHAPELVHLDLRACGLISDISVMAIAQACPHLRHLNVGRIRERARITSQSMVMIAKQTQVAVLGLAGCDIDDATLIALAKYRHTNIERISVNSCQKITNGAIQCLVASPNHCPRLTVFEMKECRIDDWYTVHLLTDKKVSLTMNDHQRYEFQAWCARFGKNGIITTPIKQT